MHKRLALFVLMLLLFFLFGCVTSNLFVPKIDAPVFVKSLICSEDMDIDLNFIAPKGFDKSIEKIQIPNAPKGIDCVVYGEEKESEGNYTVGTVKMGVNCDYWSEETGIDDNLEINELLVTWNDGSQSNEDVGVITVTGGTMPCKNYMHITVDNGTRKATYTLINDTEITGLDFPYQNEVFNIITNITINGVYLDNVSKETPIQLKKNEMCIVEYQVNDESKSQYGNVHINGFLMGKNGNNEEKIACFILDKKFGLDESVEDYLNL